MSEDLKSKLFWFLFLFGVLMMLMFVRSDEVVSFIPAVIIFVTGSVSGAALVLFLWTRKDIQDEANERFSDLLSASITNAVRSAKTHSKYVNDFRESAQKQEDFKCNICGRESRVIYSGLTSYEKDLRLCKEHEEDLKATILGDP
jgi:hypothetical protein